ncbi:cytochrome P450 monooxygenase-like protein [Amylocarpus encephaloides]|uniref:Cytochrome P450 monooxygenase-like protein n=1 Tax=Amylocarpus encephaloides TaxID=45428 RepID=A0A9P7Y5D9_9HELO|nr:cytochrome P450 monooxygenase-like protein [Amylocarpus encephaloides]
MAEVELPFKSLMAVSAISSYYLVNYQPNVLLFAEPTVVGTFAQLFTLQFFLWAVWKVVIWPKFVSPLRKLPSPSGGSWWNGQFNTIFKNTTGIPMAEWINTIPNDGLIAYRGLINTERVLVTSPKALSEVMTTRSYDFIKPKQVVTTLGRLLGVGILLAEGDEHKFQRKHLAPAFAFRHIKNLYPVFWMKARENVVKLVDHVNAGGAEREQIPYQSPEDLANPKDATPVINVGSWSARATLDIIGLAGMGKDFGAVEDEDALLSRTYRKIFTFTSGAMVIGLMSMFLPGWFVHALPIKRNSDIIEAAGTIRNVCRQEIKEKKVRLANKKYKDVDILSIALESGGFTDENLADQMMTFLAAGHETTASAMLWAIYLLCLHPEVQMRLRQEIRSGIQSLDSDVTSQEIDDIPYLHAVCNEVLRFFPPVPLTPRITARNTTILGQAIPKGTRVMLVPWAINRSEELWGPTALKFDPERWMPSESNPHSANGGASSNYAFLTFLHGPRSCIGQKFALSEFACLLAAWVGRLEFELVDESQRDQNNLNIKGGVTMKPAKGLWVKTKVVPGW